MIEGFDVNLFFYVITNKLKISLAFQETILIRIILANIKWGKTHFVFKMLMNAQPCPVETTLLASTTMGHSPASVFLDMPVSTALVWKRSCFRSNNYRAWEFTSNKAIWLDVTGSWPLKTRRLHSINGHFSTSRWRYLVTVAKQTTTLLNDTVELNYPFKNVQLYFFH